MTRRSTSPTTGPRIPYDVRTLGLLVDFEMVEQDQNRSNCARGRRWMWGITQNSSLTALRAVAPNFMLSVVWNELQSAPCRDMPFDSFSSSVRALPRRTLWFDAYPQKLREFPQLARASSAASAWAANPALGHRIAREASRTLATRAPPPACGLGRSSVARGPL